MTLGASSSTSHFVSIGLLRAYFTKAMPMGFLTDDDINLHLNGRWKNGMAFLLSLLLKYGYIEGHISYIDIILSARASSNDEDTASPSIPALVSTIGKLMLFVIFISIRAGKYRHATLIIIIRH